MNVKPRGEDKIYTAQTVVSSIPAMPICLRVYHYKGTETSHTDYFYDSLDKLNKEWEDA